MSPPAAPRRTRIDVGSTANKPELVETIPIRTAPGKGQAGRALARPGHRHRHAAAPSSAAGDRLLAFAELELTTDAEDPEPPGADRQRLLVLADGRGDDAARRRSRRARGGARQGDRARRASRGAQKITHQRHHAVVTFGDGKLAIPAGGLPWQGPSYVNVVVGASHPKAQARRRAAGGREREDAGRRPGHGRDPRRPLSPRRRAGPAARGRLGVPVRGDRRRRSSARSCSPPALRAGEGRAPAGQGAPGHRRRRARGAGADLDPAVLRRPARPGRARAARRPARR